MTVRVKREGAGMERRDTGMVRDGRKAEILPDLRGLVFELTRKIGSVYSGRNVRGNNHAAPVGNGFLLDEENIAPHMSAQRKFSLIALKTRKFTVQ